MNHLPVRAELVEARIRSPFDQLRGIGGSFLLLLTILSYLPHAYALEVQPARLELKISENQPLQGELKITNPSDKTVEVRLSTGAYRFLNPNLKLPSCQDWFRFEPESLTLAAGASTSVSYTITPPGNLDVDTAGEYLGAILVDQLPPSSEKEAGKSRVTVVPRLALAVYLMIEGREKVAVEMEDLKVDHPQPEQLKLEVKLRNLGTDHVRPSGTYALFRDGAAHHTAPLGKGMPLLPGAELNVPALLPLLPAGKYRWVVTVEVQEGTVLQKETAFEITEDGELLTGNGE